jgi:hypothetical protein
MGCLQEKLQCGHEAGISRISSGETVRRDLHLWHSNETARISSRPTIIFRSNVTLASVPRRGGLFKIQEAWLGVKRREADYRT